MVYYQKFGLKTKICSLKKIKLEKSRKISIKKFKFQEREEEAVFTQTMHIPYQKKCL